MCRYPSMMVIKLAEILEVVETLGWSIDQSRVGKEVRGPSFFGCAGSTNNYIIASPTTN